MDTSQFGVTVAWQGATIEALHRVALEADKLELGYMWIPEAWGLEGFSTASYLLSTTRNIRIGTGVVNVYSRSAALIGMGCSTMDQIAPGRFVLGLGSSGKVLVENFHGVKFEKPLERTKEYVDVIRKVARGESVEYSGNLLKLSKFRLFTRPTQQSLEIYLGAIGEKNLKLAEEICDGAIVTMYPMSRLEEATRILGEGKKLFVYFPTFVSESKEERAKLKGSIAKNIAFYTTSMGKYYASNLTKLGFGAQVRKIVEAHEKMGSNGSTSAVEDELIDELALIGRKSEVLERIARLPRGVCPVFAFSVKTSEEVASAINSLREICYGLAPSTTGTV